MRFCEIPPDNVLGRSCFIHRGDTGPGIDTRISVRDLPNKGGPLFIGERAIREMAQMIDMVDAESLGEAMEQLEIAKALAEAWQEKAEEYERSLRLLGDIMRASAEIVEEVGVEEDEDSNVLKLFDDEPLVVKK